MTALGCDTTNVHTLESSNAGRLGCRQGGKGRDGKEECVVSNAHLGLILHLPGTNEPGGLEQRAVPHPSGYPP